MNDCVSKILDTVLAEPRDVSSGDGDSVSAELVVVVVAIVDAIRRLVDDNISEEDKSVESELVLDILGVSVAATELEDNSVAGLVSWELVNVPIDEKLVNEAPGSSL